MGWLYNKSDDHLYGKTVVIRSERSWVQSCILPAHFLSCLLLSATPDHHTPFRIRKDKNGLK